MRNLTSIFSIALLAIFITSCGNEKEDIKPEPTKEDLLVGSWKANWFAYDENGNTGIDESEVEYPEAGDEYTVSFNSDKTGVATNKYSHQGGSSEDKVYFKWSLFEDGGTKIRLIDSSSYTLGNEVITYIDTSVLVAEHISADSLGLKYIEPDSFMSYIEWSSWSKMK